MKRVLALLFIMVLTVSLSSCADSLQDAEVVPNQNEATPEMIAAYQTMELQRLWQKRLQSRPVLILSQ